MTGQAAAHVTVLLEKAVNALAVNPTGIYVDGTFGRGGHSRLILEHLAGRGRLIAIDKDPEAIAHAGYEFGGCDNFEIIQSSFADLGGELAARGIEAVDGILLDLGVSSPQLDNPARGFSFSADGPLDMRMNPAVGISAARWLAEADEKEMLSTLWDFGEERFARRIVAAILAAREERPIETTAQLAELVANAVPKREPGKHPATRTFQAIRIRVNEELADVERFLEGVLSWLKVGGRLVVISFHSLEDRLVKRFMRDNATGRSVPRGVPLTDDQIDRRLRVVEKRIRPTAEESKRNPRARSAVMRVAEKLG